MKKWAFTLCLCLIFSGLVLAEPEFRIVLKNGSVLICDKILQDSGRTLLFEKDGRKMMLHKSIVDKIDKIEPVKEIKPFKKNKKEGKHLNLQEYNVERTILPGSRQDEPEEEKGPAMSVTVIEQSTSKSGEDMTFSGVAKNTFGSEIQSLKMTVSALDFDGNIISTNTVQIASVLKGEETAPFSFTFKDPDSKIARFSYNFDGLTERSQQTE